MTKKINYGGMAVIEGVMMRGLHNTSIAVRKPDGNIELEEEVLQDHAARFPFLKWPFIRGTYVLIDSMVVGVRALNKSANMSLGEEEQELSAGEILITGLVAFGLAILLFVILPTALVHYTQKYLGGIVLQSLVEGIIRISFFLIYVYGISRIGEIARVFMYHGAEHKSISTYEAGEALEVENARKYSTLHPRCGTSFLLFVMVISILVFALLGKGDLFYRIWSRIAVLPIIAGLGYEFIKVSARYQSRAWARALSSPGMWLQKLTTREPDDQQLEVALTALRAVVDADQAAAVSQ
ncbi:MAG TPA: DUF1385 domain-containing protein [Syntrophomonadaceae bacterium]|nr:DUF1385 domain-containing protein [Syntrophomonadaceae bacterium]